jgi:hypothetical protein
MCVPLFSEAAGNEENKVERKTIPMVAAVDNAKRSAAPCMQVVFGVDKTG